jgi:hypothetical protein
VQIAEYFRGHQRIVEHVGSAHTEAELGILLQCARELLDNPAQGVLDLGVEPSPPVKGLIVPAGPGLFDAAAAVTPAGRDGPGRVVGTDSRILFDALAGVFTALGFDGLADEVFRDLVMKNDSMLGVVLPSFPSPPPADPPAGQPQTGSLAFASSRSPRCALARREYSHAVRSHSSPLARALWRGQSPVCATMLGEEQ